MLVATEAGMEQRVLEMSLPDHTQLNSFSDECLSLIHRRGHNRKQIRWTRHVAYLADN